MPGRGVEPSIQTELTGRQDYSDYLRLDLLLAAQESRSQPEHHDELLFIIQHQTSELWMKLVVHELRAAIRFVQGNSLEPCFKILSRVKHVQRMLFEQWAVLETLTPTEYAEFRGVLGSASGFQSHQNRLIEFLLGNKDAAAIRVFQHRPDVLAELEAVLAAPSLYDEFLRLLGRRGFAIPEERLVRDWEAPCESDARIVEVFRQIYNAPHDHWDAYEMAEKLVDVEEHFLLWRFRHVKTVERIIGFKHGTGGSSGVPFLRRVLETRIFPELWDVRTVIGT